MAVGDVCGHGVEAAATTGLVRHTIRSTAIDGVMPSTLLRRVNEMLVRNEAERDELRRRRPAGQPALLHGAARRGPADRERGRHHPVLRGPPAAAGAGGRRAWWCRSASRARSSASPTRCRCRTRWSTSIPARRSSATRTACPTGAAGRRVFGEEGVVKALYQGKGLRCRRPRPTDRGRSARVRRRRSGRRHGGAHAARVAPLTTTGADGVDERNRGPAVAVRPDVAP